MEQGATPRRPGQLRWTADYYASLSKGLREQWECSHFTDTKVVVGERTFDCHRVVLAAMSPFFQAMYLSGMRESLDGVVNLQDVASETFESILKFVYSGEDVINAENVDNLLRAASLLQINCLRERCEDYMSDNVDPDNCLSLWKLASSHECGSLTKKARSYVLYYFRELWTSDEFLRLDLESLLSIITDNDLTTPNEEMVCEAVLLWLNSDLANRKQYTGKLFEHLRLPLMQPEYLLSAVDGNELVQNDRECQRYVEEAKRYHLLPARKQDFVSPRLVHRNHGEYEEAVICIGGNVHPERTTRAVSCYSLAYVKWITLSPLPYDIGVEFAVCTYGNAVFISGGSESLNGMFYFLITQNAWLKCSPMPIGRRRHCMVAVGDSLYILGGYDDDETEENFSTLMSVERFGVTSGTWEDCGYLTFPVRSVSASVIQDKIYIFGGIDGEGSKVNTIQCFDTRLQQCSILTTTLPLSGLSSAVVCNNTTYLIFPNGSISSMDSNGQISPLGQLSDFDRCGFGVVQHEGKLVILGGIDLSDIYDEIVVYDPVEKTERMAVQQMLRPLFGFGCVKVTISKSFFR